jgi:hypothetical protein
MQQFTAHIKNRNAIIANYATLLNHIVALGCFILGLFLTSHWWKDLILGVAIFGLGYFLFNYKALKQRFNYIDFLVLIAELLILFMVLKMWAFALVTAVYIYLFIETRKACKVMLATDCIKIQGPFVKKNIFWNELDNAMVKDELITLDFKNNKILQETVDTQKSQIDEQAFNSFCKKQLQAEQPASITSAQPGVSQTPINQKADDAY